MLWDHYNNLQFINWNSYTASHPSSYITVSDYFITQVCRALKLTLENQLPAYIRAKAYRAYPKRQICIDPSILVPSG